MLYSSMLAVILSSACLKGILSTPLPKSLVNIIRVSSLHNLGLDGNFCDAKHPGAGPCTSPLETPDSVIYVWRSSSTTEPSSTGFCVKSERSSRLSYFVFLVSPSYADGALQRETWSIPGEELDNVGLSSPLHPTVVISPILHVGLLLWLGSYPRCCLPAFCQHFW